MNSDWDPRASPVFGRMRSPKPTLSEKVSWTSSFSRQQAPLLQDCVEVRKRSALEMKLF